MPEQSVLQRKKSLVIRRITKAAPIICTRFGVKRIGIFGSFARGEQTKKATLTYWSISYLTARPIRTI